LTEIPYGRGGVIAAAVIGSILGVVVIVIVVVIVYKIIQKRKGTQYQKQDLAGGEGDEELN